MLRATQPNEDTTFSSKWNKLMETISHQEKRHIRSVTSESILELSRPSKELSLFELCSRRSRQLSLPMTTGSILQLSGFQSTTRVYSTKHLSLSLAIGARRSPHEAME
ncbi:hypothetical protein PsorP6_011679 [Peronosclerospora sorghi]|uniref:Uncharacterized protein n=1 Tax=Peronosclerospora sorghi TaxID=230839 RepID=A0ACC0WK07_9STRA|nr:hypothetical protein PsorP6_011679 [Peronosclerospora sorghi]